VDDLVVLYMVKFNTQGVDALGIQLASGESKVGKLDVPLAVHQEILGHRVEYGGILPYFGKTHLRFEIPMNIPQPMKFVHRREHLCNVEPRVDLLQHARVVE